MKAGTELDQRRDPAGDVHRPGAWLADAGDKLEHRALAGAVAADDAERAAGRNVEGDPVEGPKYLVRLEILQQASAEQCALERCELLAPAGLLVGLVNGAHFN